MDTLALTIALIADDTSLIEMLEDILQEEAYQTEVYHQDATAYRAIRATRPDLIILDLCLVRPVRGWLALDMLRLDPHTAAIPVIVCSAEPALLLAQQERLRQMQVWVLPEPFLFDELLGLITATIGIQPPTAP